VLPIVRARGAWLKSIVAAGRRLGGVDECRAHVPPSRRPIKGEIMSDVLGSGDYRYKIVEGWGKLPDGWRYGEVAGIAVDRKDRVYVDNRGAHPMIVFDREGNFQRSWGEGLFVRAHGVHIGPDDTVWLRCYSRMGAFFDQTGKPRYIVQVK
jgi:hypothetical protein